MGSACFKLVWPLGESAIGTQGTERPMGGGTIRIERSFLHCYSACYSHECAQYEALVFLQNANSNC
jgi:hypothetical protein